MFQNNTKKYWLLISALCTLIFSLKSQAALFHITPNIGYKNQTIKLSDLNDIAIDYKMNQPYYGLRIGILSGSGVNFDLSGQLFSGSGTASSLGVESSLDFNHKTLTAIIGVTAMNTLKISLGYIVMNELHLKNSSSNEIDFKGPGYQVGLGLNLTQSIAASLQYEVFQFDQVKMGSQASYQGLTNYFKKIDSRAISFGLGMMF